MGEDILWVQSVYVESIHNPWGPGLVLTVLQLSFAPLLVLL